MAEQQVEDEIESISKYLSLSDQNDEPEIKAKRPKVEDEVPVQQELDE